MSRRPIPPGFVVLGLLGTFLLPAVSLRAQEPTKHQEKLYDHESGFLGDEYSKLKPDRGNGDWLIYFRAADVLLHSDTFILEPVKVFLVPEAEQRDIPQDQLDKLSDYLYEGDDRAAYGGRLQAGDGAGAGRDEAGVCDYECAA